MTDLETDKGKLITWMTIVGCTTLIVLLGVFGWTVYLALEKIGR